ncbi:resistin-like [Acipenser oxyrinchus oxyrinchus]|uniref:Resistin-like n=1 Tax=Acipenser oxyrinchus oxyrinchus TaxID=40147 RepID=A0AAD8CDJ8_ACIOX|nr:resistin-like [Acipenser oxyrinchus oxyrinchus]
MSSLTESVASAVLQKVTLSCIDASARGSLADCPAGYRPTGCSCVMPAAPGISAMTRPATASVQTRTGPLHAAAR